MKLLPAVLLASAGFCAMTAIGAYVVAGTKRAEQSAEVLALRSPPAAASAAPSPVARPQANHWISGTPRRAPGGLSDATERAVPSTPEIFAVAPAWQPGQRAEEDQPQFRAPNAFNASRRNRDEIRPATESGEKRVTGLPPAPKTPRIRNGADQDPSGPESAADLSKGTAAGKTGPEAKARRSQGANQASFPSPQPELTAPIEVPTPIPPASNPPNPRSSWPRGNFTPEEELERAQYGWRTFAERVFEDAMDAEPVEANPR